MRKKKELIQITEFSILEEATVAKYARPILAAIETHVFWIQAATITIL